MMAVMWLAILPEKIGIQPTFDLLGPVRKHKQNRVKESNFTGVSHNLTPVKINLLVLEMGPQGLKGKKVTAPAKTTNLPNANRGNEGGMAE